MRACRLQIIDFNQVSSKPFIFFDLRVVIESIGFMSQSLIPFDLRLSATISIVGSFGLFSATFAQVLNHLFCAGWVGAKHFGDLTAAEAWWDLGRFASRLRIFSIPRLSSAGRRGPQSS
jgi:hypothetical protein